MRKQWKPGLFVLPLSGMGTRLMYVRLQIWLNPIWGRKVYLFFFEPTSLDWTPIQYVHVHVQAVHAWERQGQKKAVIIRFANTRVYASRTWCACTTLRAVHIRLHLKKVSPLSMWDTNNQQTQCPNSTDFMTTVSCKYEAHTNACRASGLH